MSKDRKLFAEPGELECQECGTDCERPIFVEQLQEIATAFEYGARAQTRARTIRSGVYCTWGCLATVAAIEGGRE